MLLAGLIDLGVPLEVIERPLIALGLDGHYTRAMGEVLCHARAHPDGH